MSAASRSRARRASGAAASDDPVARKRHADTVTGEIADQLRIDLDALESGAPRDPAGDTGDTAAANGHAGSGDADAIASRRIAARGMARRLPRRATPRGDLVPRLTAPGWTPDKQRAFVTHLAVHGCVDQAARHVGLSRQSAYQLRNRLPNSMFAMAWDTAMMLARRSLMEIAIERAINGREEEVWSRGELVGTRVVHNDRMLMFVIAQKAEPVHGLLSNPELHQLWPNMLADIDAVLPPVLSKADLAAKAEERRENGND